MDSSAMVERAERIDRDADLALVGRNFGLDEFGSGFFFLGQDFRNLAENRFYR
jgi:hypothetical protein